MFTSCEPHKEYNSNYRGIVVDNYDPDVMGKCKIFVPGVYPSEYENSPERLPWSEPVMCLQGGNFQPHNPGHLNPETGYTTIPHEGAHVWVFFERGDWNYPKHWAASQAGDGWVSENNNQHTVRTDNVTLIIDEKPYLPAEARGGDPWGAAIAVSKRRADASTIANAIYLDLLQGLRGYAVQTLEEIKSGPYIDNLVEIQEFLSQSFEPVIKEEVADWTVRVELQNKDQADLFIEYYSDVFKDAYGENIVSGGPDESIYAYAYQIELDDEPNDTSTQRYDTFNKQCTDLSVTNWQKLQQPTMVDIKIHMLSGCAANIMITGDTNMQIIGDVYEEIIGNKHTTLSGNAYYHHVGDYHHYHEGQWVLEHDGDYLEKTRGNKSITVSDSQETYIGGSNELRIGSDYTINTGANKTESVGGGFTQSVKGDTNVKFGTYNLQAGNESRNIKGGSSFLVDGDYISNVKGNYTVSVVGKTKFEMDSQALFRSTSEIAIVSRTNKVILQAEAGAVDIYATTIFSTYSTATKINAAARIDLLRAPPMPSPQYKVPYV